MPATPGTVVTAGNLVSPAGDIAQSQVGNRWFNGSGPPPTPYPGSMPGDMYLDTSTGDVYVL